MPRPTPIVPSEYVSQAIARIRDLLVAGRRLDYGVSLASDATAYELRSPGDGNIWRRNGPDDGWDYIGKDSAPYLGVPRPSIQIEGFELAYGDYPSNTFPGNKIFSVKPGRISIDGNGTLAKLTKGVIEYFPKTEAEVLSKTVSKTNAWVAGKNQPGSILDPNFFHSATLSYPMRLTTNAHMAVFLMISESTKALDIAYGPFCSCPQLIPASDRYKLAYEISDFRIDLPASYTTVAGGPWRVVCRLGYLPVFETTTDHGILKFYANGNRVDLLEKSTGNTNLVVLTEASTSADFGSLDNRVPPNVVADIRCKFPLQTSGARHSLRIQRLNKTVRIVPEELYSPPGDVEIWSAIAPNEGTSFSINLKASTSMVADLSVGTFSQSFSCALSRSGVYATLRLPGTPPSANITNESTLLGWNDYSLPRIPFRGHNF